MSVILRQDPIDFTGNVIAGSAYTILAGDDSNALVSKFQSLFMGNIHLIDANGSRYLTPQQWIPESTATPDQISSALQSQSVQLGNTSVTYLQTPSMFQYKITDITALYQIQQAKSQINDLYSNTQAQVSTTLSNKSDVRSITETLYNLTIVLNPPALNLNPNPSQSNAALAGLTEALAVFSSVNDLWQSQDTQVVNLNAQIDSLQQQQNVANASGIIYIPGFNWTDPLNPPRGNVFVLF